MRKPAACGTNSGWATHMKKKEKPCEPCKLARKEWAAKHYQKNKAKINAQYKIYYNNNKEKIQKYLQEYNIKNNDELTKKKRKYYQDNKEVFRAAMRRREVKKFGSVVEVYTKEDVLNKWGTICHICLEEIDLNLPRSIGKPGWQRGLHLDHVVPISRGGSDTLDNVKPAHAICNLNKFNSINIDNLLAEQERQFI